jgi:hypothetical protein
MGLLTSKIRFRLGMRVCNRSYMNGLPIGATGTVALVAGVRGKSIYCDPSRVMVFVQWDNGTAHGVFRGELEKSPK